MPPSSSTYRRSNAASNCRTRRQTSPSSFSAHSNALDGLSRSVNSSVNLLYGVRPAHRSANVVAIVVKTLNFNRAVFKRGFGIKTPNK